MKRPHVAVITLHRVHNFGSVLQTYATHRLLTRAGASVDIVDYWRPTEIPGREAQMRHNYARWNSHVVSRNAFWALRGRSLTREHTNFSDFVETGIPLTASYLSATELRNSPPVADIYCVGSDQVWNSDYHVAGSGPFFLDFAPEGAPRMSLASSFGKSQINDAERANIEEHLSRFASVSVRESSAVDILNDHGIKSTHVIDPTLALEPGEWIPDSSPGPDSDNYLLVYQLHRHSPLAPVAVDVARKRNLRIITIQGFWSLKNARGRNLSNTAVVEFLQLIRGASYIVTDSFHGTAFSLNFGKPFNSVYPSRYSERIESLLTKTATLDRAVKPDSPTYSTSDLDANAVARVLNRERSVLADYMTRALGVG